MTRSQKSSFLTSESSAEAGATPKVSLPTPKGWGFLLTGDAKQGRRTLHSQEPCFADRNCPAASHLGHLEKSNEGLAGFAGPPSPFIPPPAAGLPGDGG